MAAGVEPSPIKDVILVRLVDVAGNEGMEVKVDFKSTKYRKKV